jgi:SAM-dependent methyltransferase
MITRIPGDPGSKTLAGTFSGNDCLPMLDSLIGTMSCPNCAADLTRSNDEILCGECDTRFPVQNGIPLMATYGSSEIWTDEAPPDSSRDYQVEYKELSAAAVYNEAYREKREKRWSTRGEFKILGRLLSGQPRCESLLNIPCGGGRLSDKIAEATDKLIEADTAHGQVLYARAESGDVNHRLWMTASAFHIPFKNDSFDGVVCCRLSHHMPTAVERERLVKELLRVSRHFVIMTFFDFHSPKNFLRRIREPFNKKPPKMTMTRARLAELASQRGAKLVDAPALAYPFSGHRFALMVKHSSPE